MICCVCRKKLPDDALFCCYCGKKQITSSATYHRRGNGLGSVYKTPSGSWCAESTLGWYVEDGKRKRKKARKAGFKTKKEAVLYLEQLQNQSAPRKSVTFSELWEKFQPALAEISSSKQGAYRIAWNRVSPFLAFRKIEEVSTDELCRIAEDTAEQYYPRRDIKGLLSNLYKIALRDDLIDKNRSEFIKLPKHETAEREIFSDDDIQLLWDDFHKTNELVTAGMLTMIYTGMRPAELLSAVAENVHLDEHYLTGGKKTEKGKRRKIIIPDKLVPVIRSMLSQSSGKLCRFSNADAFYKTWLKKRASLGLRESLVPYCARHTYVTRCTNLGISPAMLKELVGHEDYETTLAYTHLSIADRLDAVNRL